MKKYSREDTGHEDIILFHFNTESAFDWDLRSALDTDAESILEFEAADERRAFAEFVSLHDNNKTQWIVSIDNS